MIRMSKVKAVPRRRRKLISRRMLLLARRRVRKLRGSMLSSRLS